MISETKYVNEVIFAARIYGISRFTESAPTVLVQRYERLFSRYFDLAALAGILNGEPKFASLHDLVVRAFTLAGTESDKAEQSVQGGKNLSCVFSRLSSSMQQKDRRDFYRYEPAVLSPELAFPKQSVSSTDLSQLRSGFYREMDALAQHPPKDRSGLFVAFDRICRRYLWCVSATDYEGEDISLYDLMKVTQALAACLAQCEKEDTPYTMVAGDFSGIQNYIFAVSSVNQSGVSKRLRARSFYVDVLSRVLSQAVVDRFGVDRANILMQTGGKFYCIVPTAEDMDEMLQSIRDEFDQALFHEFHGTVSVNFAWICCGDNNIRLYSDTIVELNRRLSEKKTEPFSSVLKREQGWNTDAFILNSDLREKHLCKSCGMELIPTSQEACPVCRMQFQMGTQLPHSKYIVYSRGRAADAYHIFEDYSIRLTDRISAEDSDKAYLIEILGEGPVAPEQAGLPYTYKYMANQLPARDGEPMTFSDLADAGGGVSRLAVLRADVDVLGYLFSQGLCTTQRHYGTISRVNTMSRMLEVFFSGYVKQMISTPAYSNVYSVFSGGDDLFLLGPWDVMPDLALDIQKQFKRFVAENPDVTMSASVSIFGGRDHVAYMAEKSKQQLDRAKNDRIPEVYPECSGRDAVCFMDRVFSWDDFKTQIQNADMLRGLLNKGRVNVSILRRIAKYSGMYQKFLLDRDIWQLMFEPLFYYDRERNYDVRSKDPDMVWFGDYVISMDNAANYRNIRKNLYFADIAVKTALDKTKRGRS